MDNSGKEAEAMALLAEAERKVKNSQSFFSGLFGGSSKIEEACEIYARAANMFKMAKNWSAAGNAFCQAAQLHLQLQSKHDAATCFVDAGNAFKKADPQGDGMRATGPLELAAQSPRGALSNEVLGFLGCGGSGFLQGPTGDRPAGRLSCFNFRIGSLPVGICILLQASASPFCLCVQLTAPLPEAWEHLGVGVTFQTHRMPRGEENLFCCQN
ncbi:Alpha-soluble NSF attachment protein [Pteropus alecto]|uniref:Alpha-soluble NSF attachment protein n=2 Tax=Pteropus alecto TaxID=9402 RepID=L5L5Q4_PTEAL|nr:Alpha-soluble NSF attachment protein [Pteropus alecto]